MEALENEISRLSVASESARDDSFHLFPELPAELRLQIWHHAVDALPGRIINLWVNEGYGDRVVRYRTNQFCPDLVTVCSEALAAVCQVYLPLFPMAPQHSQARVCLQKDTLLLSEHFSCLSQREFRYKIYLPELLEALGPEKCLEIRELALEVRTNFQWGRYLISDWHLYPWQGYPATKTAHQVFPKLEKMIYVPCIGPRYKYKYCDSHARAHIGELEFVPRQSGKWVKGRKKWADRVQWRLRNAKEPELEYEVMQLGIVGGEKKKSWDPDNFLHWRLMTKEEVERYEAKRKDIELKRRQRLGLPPLSYIERDT